MKSIISINKFFLIVAILFFTACGSDSDDPITVTPPVSTTLAGDYSGTWDSTTPTASFFGVDVSARLTSNAQETRLSGPFFISPNLEPCCGATNDGRIVIELDGNTITSFTYTDAIPGCTGNVSGTGEIISTGALVIDFTGTDCDGEHTGELVLTKK